MTAGVGKILGGVTGLLREAIPDADKRQEVEAALETTIVQAQRDVIVAEATSDNWLTSSYRPVLALATCTPLLRAVVTGDYASVPPEVWSITSMVLGGLVGTRGVEKIVREGARALRSR